MEIEFRNKDLEDLYQGKKVKSKIFKSNPIMVKNFIKTINKITNATDLNMLKRIGGLNLEDLTDDPNGFSSVRIDKKYRLTIDLVKDEADEVKIVGLEEITNHYR